MEYLVKICAPGDENYVPWNTIQADDNENAIGEFNKKFKHSVTHQFALEEDDKIIYTSYDQSKLARKK